MVGWSHLPPEIKQHVVKNLDFMSRHSLKCTSSTDRQIVNSTPLNIPRVRLSRRGEQCLVVIYTGVGQFLRWEISENDDGDGVVIERSENCYDYTGFKRIVVPDTHDVLEMGIIISKHLVAQKSIKINVFEWDFTCIDEAAHLAITKEITRYLNGDVFHATELAVVTSSVFRGISIDPVSKFIHGFKKISVLNQLIAPHQSCVAVKTMELERRHIGFLMSRSENIFYGQDDFIESFTKSQTLKAVMQSDEKCVCSMVEREVAPPDSRAPENQIHKIQRSEEDGFIKLTYITKCGKYSATMLPKDEPLLRNQLINMKCGMSFLCKSCAGPFEYWYRQNLAMRFIFQEEWMTTFVMVGEDQMNRLRSLYGKLNKRMKPSKPSWGFKKVQKKVEKEVVNLSKKKEKQMLEKKIIRRKNHQVKNPIPRFIIWFGVVLTGYIVICMALKLGNVFFS